MAKTLIIAEKPSVASDLARALGKVPKKGDHFENDEYVISSAVGHVVELEMPEDIDKKKYGYWRLETLPIIPEKFGLKPIEASKERFAALKKLLALALEFFLRGLEARNVRCDLFALPCQTSLSLRDDHFAAPLIRLACI